MSQVVFSKDALKYLSKVPRASARRVIRAIRTLAKGTASRAKTGKLSGKDLWRLKIGRIRVIYRIEEKSGHIEVIKIGPRGDVYK